METQMMKVNGHLQAPEHLELERRLSSILADDRATVTSAELRELMQAAEIGIVDAQEAARSAKEAALDPTVTPDPTEARAQSEDAALMAGRLHTLLGRLQRRCAEVAQAERLKEWREQFADLKRERDDLALEFDEDYPALINQLVDLGTRMVTLDGKLSRLHQARPSGVLLHLDSPELMARGLDAFSRAAPSLLTQLKLHDRHGKQVWPPVVPRDMSMFDPERYADPRAGPDWWKFKEQDAAHAKAESERVQEYYARQQKEREAREKETGK
jgi:hypothetical protein